MKTKEKIRFYFDDIETPMGKLVDLTVITLIFLACILYIIQTYTTNPQLQKQLEILELAVGLIFTIEYLLRMWVAKNKISHFFKIYSIIDLIAIIPVFVAFTNLQFLRVFRLFRIFRFLRFLEDHKFFFGEITETMLIGTRIIFTIFTIVFVSSGLILSAEHLINPEINTFLDATYFSIVTLSTVGFGDIVPVTQAGRIVTLLIITSGIIFIPWQAGTFIKKTIMVSGKTQTTCKKCGLTHHDPDAIHCKHCGHLIFHEST